MAKKNHNRLIVNTEPPAFKIGDISVSIASERPEIVEDFSAIYGGFRVDGPHPEKMIHMEVRRTRRGLRGSRFCIFGDGEEYAANRTIDEVFPYLEWGINQRIVETRPEYLQLHAASLERDGKGFIFVGESGSGKTTLAAGLLTRGWRYFCDEFALIHRESLDLHAFPKALCVKAGSFPVAQHLRLPFVRCRDYVKGFKGKVAYVNPLAFGEKTVADPVPVRYIIFPRYAAGARPHVYSVSRSQAVLELLSSTFNRSALGSRAIELLGSVVRGAACYRLVSGDIDSTCDVVESLLERSTEPTCGTKFQPTRRRGSLLNGAANIGKKLSRRDLLRRGAKIAYIAPIVLSFSVQEAMAGGSNPSALCSTAVPQGGLCSTDTDCCSNNCSIGVCQ